uniref:Tryptophan 2,3-dioxygenase n=1 Tax=Percolomonas cosmopolitus TaxID=63605 RepID=A0A7S1PGJ5_9EUKA|eukprot:CAMPEP_0117448082 /NCGR_PEP_ID=MMETSP0759-20121206/7212_1 /TAXON_ID=63605 /ORGANISM="Percolomonas cosmopolitus, Strain WS" /LENGTH=433 /DNA_ID=CAMNT_0005240447 /DNA_START=23 /DNA_END=1324 /DNA_ORIENTATION=-
MSSKNYGSLHSCQSRLPAKQLRDIPPTYADYLEIAKLLKLQDSVFKKGLHHHEEHLFITTHQSFELWFKQILLDLKSLKNIMDDDEEPTTPEKEVVILERMDRIEKILKFSLGTFDLLETMPSLNFLEFRDYITPASGFQSAQYKELEVMLGQRRFTSGKYLSILKGCDAEGYVRVKDALDSKSFKDVLYEWMEALYDRNVDLMKEFQVKYEAVRQETLDYILSIKQDDEETRKKLLERDFDGTLKYLQGEPLSRQEKQLYESETTPQEGGRSASSNSTSTDTSTAEESSSYNRSGTHDSTEEPIAESSSREWKERCAKRRLAILFVSCYRYTPELANAAKILEGAINLEQAFLMWKYRHARMVERMIGHKTGTGGSTGVDYLDLTTKQRIFHDLWHVRSHLVTPTALPQLDTFKYWIPSKNIFSEQLSRFDE